ncbi:MAG TPA: 1-phosphofructokinase family hexose kinase [Chloroflexota bacterium]|nr:1-phosphofructokinase family hexose kinase [Chloroflexota bacterium]
MKHPITVLSLNTALDRIEVVSGFATGRVFRAERVLVCPGGKGANVARALRMLGEPVRITGFLGGSPAPILRSWCDEAGIGQRWIETAGESRTCVIVVDPSTAAQSVVNEPGPFITPDELAALRAELERGLVPDSILCIAGSAPPGVPDTFYAEVVELARERGVRTLADVAGSVLRTVVAAHPWALTPNLDEARAAFGGEDDAETLARRLQAAAGVTILTLGAGGAILATQGCRYRFTPPSVRTVNAVGSGDALVAGFLAGVSRGRSPVEAMRLGIACGASNAARLEPQIGPPEEIDRLESAVTCECSASSPQ